MSFLRRFIILLPITYVLGGIYESFLWARLPTDLQILTYLGPKARLMIVIKPVLTTSVSLLLFYVSRRTLLSWFKSETTILVLWTVVSILVIMNPFVLWAIAYTLRMAPMPPIFQR